MELKYAGWPHGSFILLVLKLPHGHCLHISEEVCYTGLHLPAEDRVEGVRVRYMGDPSNSKIPP